MLVTPTWSYSGLDVGSDLVPGDDYLPLPAYQRYGNSLHVAGHQSHLCGMQSTQPSSVDAVFSSCLLGRCDDAVGDEDGCVQCLSLIHI